MSPFRLLLLIVFTVMVTVITYVFAQVSFLIIDTYWRTMYGRNFTWDDLPPPIGPVLRDAWNIIVPNFLLIAFIFMLIVEFVSMFSRTQEGYYYPYE